MAVIIGPPDIEPSAGPLTREARDEASFSLEVACIHRSDLHTTTDRLKQPRVTVDAKPL